LTFRPDCIPDMRLSSLIAGPPGQNDDEVLMFGSPT
jgi:hypothetical protein